MTLQPFLQAVNGLNHWQIDAAATLLLLQGAVFAVFPEEVILLGLGALCGTNRISFPEAMAAGAAGLLPANACMAFLGRTFGHVLLRRRPFSWVLKRGAVARARLFLSRYGARVIFVTRFVPTIRGPVYFSAGAGRMAMSKFIRMDALAYLIHAPLLLAIGAWLSRG